MRLWDANTGNLLRTFENHHSRGYVSLNIDHILCWLRMLLRIASIDFKPPFVLSGSSDKHLRLFDITTLLGWSTSPEYDSGDGGGTQAAPLPLPSSSVPAFQSLSNTNNPPSGFTNSYCNDYAAFGEQGQAVMCQMCGNSGLVALGLGSARRGQGQIGDIHKNILHRDLVRSVAFGDKFVLSGSYDLSIKVGSTSRFKMIGD